MQRPRTGAGEATARLLMRGCAQTYEGGLGGEPGNEAHGGYTFCGLAALLLAGRPDALDLPRLAHWAACRQARACRPGPSRVAEWPGQRRARRKGVHAHSAPRMSVLLAQECGGRRGRVQRASGRAGGLPAALARAGAAPEQGGERLPWPRGARAGRLLRIQRGRAAVCTDAVQRPCEGGQGPVEGGFMGRTNKLVDGCYSFWLGGLFPLLRSLPPGALAAPAPPAADALAAAAAARGPPAVPVLPELAVVGPAAQAQAAAERAHVRACAGPPHAGVWAR